MIIDPYLLEQAAYDADLDPNAVRLDYSGRGMFGLTCVGVVHSSPGDLLKFVHSLQSQLEEEGVEPDPLYRVSQDNMGLGIISYWPEIQAQEDENAS